MSYIALFFSAAQLRVIVPAALTVLGITVMGLASVNMSDELASVLEEGQSTLPYWIQTGLIAVYFVVLVVLYFHDMKTHGSKLSANTKY